jgi:hypothetical protein
LRLRVLALLALGAVPAGARTLDGFPRANEVFPRLIADPRSIQLSASYYRRAGDNDSDVALGHSWGMTRWRTGSALDLLWEWDLEAMAYSRFKVGGGVNEFETVDFFANLPLTMRRGDVAFKGMLFHESSHLGDDFIRRTGNAGFRYSVDGLRLQVSIEPTQVLRVYAGGEYLYHLVPLELHRASLQAGVELISRDVSRSQGAPVRLFIAEDVQSHQRVAWNVDSHTVAGVKFGFKDFASRAMRFQIGYFTGHSPYGQFFSQRDHYADVSLIFEL